MLASWLFFTVCVLTSDLVEKFSKNDFSFSPEKVVKLNSYYYYNIATGSGIIVVLETSFSALHDLTL